MSARVSFSLSFRERVGVRGWAGAVLFDAGLSASGAVCSPLRSQDPLTPTLSRREREQTPCLQLQPSVAEAL